MIKITNVSKQFGQLKAVNNLNLNIKKGEIFGFIGPNGAGKTTTIKMLTGIIAPSTGKITIGGFDIQSKPVEAKKLLGYIPDDPYVYPDLTGREFLHLVGELYGLKGLEKKIKQLLPIYKIEQIIDGPFKDFSRGNKQKLVILAALLHKPKVLIIDEPIVVLDPWSAQVTVDNLRKFAEKENGTIFLSTHTLNVAEKICHRIGVIDQGKLIFEGTLNQLTKKVKTKEKNLEKLYLKLTAHV